MTKKILIVDDDPGICHSLAMLMRGEGYFVDATTDSREAVILVKKDKYDICFFDYKMKPMNGLNLSKITKDITPQSSVFIISGMLDIDNLCKKEIDAGVVAGIIKKPFDIEALLQRIAAIV